MKLGRDVAVKALSDAFAHGAVRLARFEWQAQVPEPRGFQRNACRTVQYLVAKRDADLACRFDDVVIHRDDLPPANCFPYRDRFHIWG